MKKFIYSSIAFLFIACAAPTQNDRQEVLEEQPHSRPEHPLQSKILVSKGIIRSANEVHVFSRIEGQLLDVTLKEGDRVRKGQLLFSLDDWDLLGKVHLSVSEREQAKLRMEEILVGQGYKRDHFDEVPESIARYARIKSGLDLCEEKLEVHKARLAQARISAPLSGIVTGVTPLPYSFVRPGETLCTIVDPSHLVVEFSILETELAKFEIGKGLEVISIAYPELKHPAKVSSIGSTVDANGMVSIVAVIADSEHLLPGMTAIVNL